MIGRSRFRKLTAEEERALASARPAAPPKGLRGEARREWLATDAGLAWSGWLRSEERRALIESCLALAWRVAGPYRRPPLGEDAVGIAELALVRAADLFDPKRNVRFTTYVAKAVKLQIDRQAAELVQPIAIPSYLRDRLRAEAAGRTLAAPGPANWREMAPLARRVMAVASLSAAGEGLEPAGAGAGPGEALEGDEERERLAARVGLAIAGLDGRTAEAVRLRHFPEPGSGRALTLREVGERIGISKDWAGRLVARGHLRLRPTLEREVAS